MVIFMDPDVMQKLEKTGYKAIPVICGPTASGKTSLSIRAAKELNGEICCCDSMQIYRHLTVGTAKPTEEEKREVPHHLIDLVEPDQPFNVASYLENAYEKIEELLSRNVLPVFCGGTGQYVQALQKGFDFSGAPVDHEKEEELRREFEQERRKKYVKLRHRTARDIRLFCLRSTGPEKCFIRGSTSVSTS